VEINSSILRFIPASPLFRCLQSSPAFLLSAPSLHPLCLSWNLPPGTGALLRLPLHPRSRSHCFGPIVGSHSLRGPVVFARLDDISHWKPTPRHARNYSSYQYAIDDTLRALAPGLSCNLLSVLRRQSFVALLWSLACLFTPYPVEIQMEDVPLCDSALSYS